MFNIFKVPLYSFRYEIVQSYLLILFYIKIYNYIILGTEALEHKRFSIYITFNEQKFRNYGQLCSVVCVFSPAVLSTAAWLCIGSVKFLKGAYHHALCASIR